ncbi:MULTISPECIES: HNH endonuclease family protein [Tsukamurella]|uniref:HNH endonuclease n=2 Tax=Tsukamurella TaxID=2060 RepID=A0A5C5S2L0_9ACTN|nr:MULTISPECIES: HNH endonuclease family protein [Tsukamurella]NMD54825.1 HNH endonuclease [Tsukamurella columbiensis]TWS29676.1 HNH endonuclease [Tsukamurella conjunctivitidis]
MSRQAWVSLILVVATAVFVAVGVLRDRSAGDPSPGPASPSGTVSDGAPLAGVRIVAARERAPQPYRRAAFGKAWTDDQSAPLGHNGCDTRNDVLDRDLKNKTYVRTSGCPSAVATGTLVDPYSGTTMRFERGAKTSAKVQIDHVIALAYAWDMGAWSWDDAKRTVFANDPRNLVAVDGPANENKRDSPPGRWMPANGRFHCQYARQFSFIAREYGLSVDRASSAVIEQAGRTCS